MCVCDVLHSFEFDDDIAQDEEVEAVKARMDELRERNRRGELMPPDEDDEGGDPPLL